jgi:general secretion pathway protein G
MRRAKVKQRIFASESGFTLLEILAVLTLLAIIITLVTPNIVKQLQNGQVKATFAQVNSLKSVLNSYYLDNSCFPTTEQGLKALIEKPLTPPEPGNWNGPYLEDQKIPKDAWGQEIKYLSPGIHNPGKFDLYSYGKDKQEGGEGDNADIGNW